MGLSKTIWASPSELIRTQTPENPVLVFAPMALQATARRFLDGFPGLVTYAVKSNPDEMVIQNLIAAGVTGFDVASPYEIAMIRRLAPSAALHYHNPVRSRAEIAFAVEHGVTVYSVDSRSELAKLAEMVPAEGTEVSVRFKLPVKGSAYNFGAKFGATADVAAELLREVVACGFTPSITFHPGTQVNDLTLVVAVHPCGGGHRARCGRDHRAAERRRRLPVAADAGRRADAGGDFRRDRQGCGRGFRCESPGAGLRAGPGDVR